MLGLTIPPPPARTGPLPVTLARTIRSIVAAPDADAETLLALADTMDRIAALGESAFDASPDELRRAGFVLRELTGAAGPRPLSAIQADRTGRAR